MTIYLDCNATTPIEPAVAEVVRHYMEVEFGNAGSRTHEFGQRAAEAVTVARRQVASVVGAGPEEIIFTSGATEALNLAIFGLAEHGEKTGRRHIVSTTIEHKAVLEPLQEMQRRGFEITLVPVGMDGAVDADAVAAAVRSDTLLIAVMQVNNETGVIQPVEEIAERLIDHDAYLLVDAAQGFGKVIDPLRHKRIDLIAVSGHKIYGPKGIGALVARTRGYKRPPLKPLMFGGGQERGLRPGTVAVPLAVGLGKAAELALERREDREAVCKQLRAGLLAALSKVPHIVLGDQVRSVCHTLSVAFPGVNSETAMLLLKDIVSVSNGAACTSAKYEPSHVLLAMGVAPDAVRAAVRFSWSHLTQEPNWSGLPLYRLPISLV